MYHTYITDALVCGSRRSNTADRTYLLFTRNAGMLTATARSVREERSKQRFALQEFSHVRITLVQGKAGWRIAGVESLGNLYSEAKTREKRSLIRKTTLLLRRLMQGEAPHEEVFDMALRALRSDDGNPGDIERLLSLRILNMLGYVAPLQDIAHLLQLQGTSKSEELTPNERTLCDSVIQQALEHSQL